VAVVYLVMVFILYGAAGEHPRLRDGGKEGVKRTGCTGWGKADGQDSKIVRNTSIILVLFESLIPQRYSRLPQTHRGKSIYRSLGRLALKDVL
jgi:hypothetical protein